MSQAGPGVVGVDRWGGGSCRAQLLCGVSIDQLAPQNPWLFFFIDHPVKGRGRVLAHAAGEPDQQDTFGAIGPCECTQERVCFLSEEEGGGGNRREKKTGEAKGNQEDPDIQGSEVKGFAQKVSSKAGKRNRDTGFLQQ